MIFYVLDMLRLKSLRKSARNIPGGAAKTAAGEFLL